MYQYQLTLSQKSFEFFNDFLPFLSKNINVECSTSPVIMTAELEKKEMLIATLKQGLFSTMKGWFLTHYESIAKVTESNPQFKKNDVFDWDVLLEEKIEVIGIACCSEGRLRREETTILKKHKYLGWEEIIIYSENSISGYVIDAILKEE